MKTISGEYAIIPSFNQQHRPDEIPTPPPDEVPPNDPTPPDEVPQPDPPKPVPPEKPQARHRGH